VLRQVHLWLGLSAGLLLSAIGLSGAALIFAEPLVRHEAPQLFADTKGGEWRPVSEWLASAERRYPELAPFKFAFGPGTIPMPTGVPILFTLAKKDGGERHVLIPIDPVKGVALERVDAEDTWSGLLVIFHKELLAHDIGILLVAISGLVGLISVVTGTYLWWPRRGRWGAALRIRRAARGVALLYDLHSVPAAWLLLPLTLALFSGLYLQKDEWVDPIVSVISDVREAPQSAKTSSPSGTCQRETTVDDAIALAKQGREDQVLRHVFLPMGPRGAYNVELRKPDANSRAGGTLIHVDRNCPRVLHVAAVEDMTLGEQLKRWMWPLHTNLMLGWFGQALVLLAGLSLPALFLTGLLYWLKTRR
jgi:uncharacterized iron-regulated membrane protein